MSKKVKKKVLASSKMLEQDIPISIGANYGKRRSATLKLNYPTNGGQRTAEFYLFPLDFMAAEIMREYGGNITHMPKIRDVVFDVEFKENIAMLMACLDFEKGAWSRLENESNRPIEFPRNGTDEEKLEAVKMIAGAFSYANTIRQTCISLAASFEMEFEEDEKNSGNGSETVPEPETTQK